MIFLPNSFSICSICNHVFLSWTKFIEIPLRPNRPVRPDKKMSSEKLRFVNAYQYDGGKCRYRVCHQSLDRSWAASHSWRPCLLVGCQSHGQWHSLWLKPKKVQISICNYNNKKKTKCGKSTLSRPSRNPSMIASRSRESFAPCREATLCPSTVIRCEMRSAVCRCYVVFF